MFGEVLKFGAMIVDALRTYRHPVSVYIPPNGELRGGAWVVIDPTINPSKMEMYADVQARGGILEPPGICEVKYRGEEQRQTMHRLDPVLLDLDQEISAAVAEGKSEDKSLSVEVGQREKVLAPLYAQIANEFADLHDRAGRMVAKGCIRQALTWKTSRRFFFWRIRRRLAEERLTEAVAAALGGEGGVDKAKQTATAWLESHTTTMTDEQAVQWLAGAGGALADQMVAQTATDARKQQAKASMQKLSPEDLRQLLEEMSGK